MSVGKIVPVVGSLEYLTILATHDEPLVEGNPREIQLVDVHPTRTDWAPVVREHHLGLIAIVGEHVWPLGE